MPQIWFGKKGNSGGVRIAKSSALDVASASDTNPGLWLFNSAWRDQLYIDSIFRDTSWTWSPSAAYGMPWVPIVETRIPAALNARRAGPAVSVVRTATGNLSTIMTFRMMGTPGYRSGYDTSESADGPSRLVSVLELPATSAALASPTATPVSGQQNVLINPSTVRISRPGFSVASASGRQLIINSDRIPAKIIRCGQLNIAAGANTFISSPFTLTADCYLDYHVSPAADQLSHPPSIFPTTALAKLDFDYRVEAGGVRLYNDSSFSITVRYMLCADDSAANSVGGNEVMRVGTEAGVRYAQIKRPGSSDVAPRLNDIMLDTRLSYVPIVADGYISLAQFTESTGSPYLGTKAKTISFTNTGFLPFVKYVCRLSNGDYRNPIATRLYSQGAVTEWQNRPSSWHSIALLSTSSVKFCIADGNPSDLVINPNNTVSGEFVNFYRPIGIRYFIYAIPTSL